ncbi:hypothetical protein LOK49_LG02G02114 [Camellia lanceoleosa]|uniref:Uncharacterized protein n=1 Tax=Camellia lanceoleosa TaxID=1840588 RepID=A0ACC0IS70_9ERIC|nr:hypothetical protein LOK49_LG02G02114 [Camellia lanceoleosa]
MALGRITHVALSGRHVWSLLGSQGRTQSSRERPVVEWVGDDDGLSTWSCSRCWHEPVVAEAVATSSLAEFVATDGEQGGVGLRRHRRCWRLELQQWVVSKQLQSSD